MQDDTDWPVFSIDAPPRILLSGADYRGLRVHLDVSQGAQIGAGQIVFGDAKRRWIRIPSPVSGRVTSTQRGPRGSLSHIEIEASATPQSPTPRDAIPADANAAHARQALVDAGLWSAIRQRPFDSIPDPDFAPKAILITAMFSDHEAPDLARVMAQDRTKDDFAAGVGLVATLAACPTFVCHVRGDNLPVPEGAPEGVPERTNVKLVAFGRRASERLVGAHVRQIAPATSDAVVWYINWQDVVVIGQFARTGVMQQHRLLCLRGASVQPPLLVRAPVGTPLSDIAVASGSPVLPTGTAIITGDPLRQDGAQSVGRYDDRLSVVRTLPPANRTPKHPRANRFFQRRANRTGPIIPHRGLMQSLPGHPAPIALLRALSIGDVDTAQRLGCLDLSEPDVAACSMACVSGHDYPALLRRVLDELADA